MRSRSTKLSFIGVTSVSALRIAARAIGSSRPGVSITSTSACFRQAADRGFEARLALVLEHFIGRAGKLLVEPAHRRVAIFEIAGHGPLALIEVERTDPVARRGERDRGVDRGGRLAGAALFIGEDDEVRLAHGLLFPL